MSAEPTRAAISRMTDAELEALDERYQQADELTEEQLTAWGHVNSEQDAREDWNSDDDRIREAVGNYRSHLA